MVIVMVLCLLAAMPLQAFGMDISVCGQAVPQGDVGNLRANLACGPTGSAVFLASKATLNLNGFTIGGSGDGTGVECASGRGCTVNGPGAIVGFGTGVSGTGRVVVTGLGVRANDVGISTKGASLTVAGIVVTENRVGISVAAGRLRGIGFETSRNRDTGIQTTATRTRLTSLVAVDNGALGGVYVTTPRGGRVRIEDSTILGNDGLGAGYDVITTGRVKLVNTVCGRGARVRVSRTSPKTRTVVGSLGCRDD